MAEFEIVPVYQLDHYGSCDCCSYEDAEGNPRNGNDYSRLSLEPNWGHGSRCEVAHHVIRTRGRDLYLVRAERWVGFHVPGLLVLTTDFLGALKVVPAEWESSLGEIGSWIR